MLVVVGQTKEHCVPSPGRSRLSSAEKCGTTDDNGCRGVGKAEQEVKACAGGVPGRCCAGSNGLKAL